MKQISTQNVQRTFIAQVLANTLSQHAPWLGAHGRSQVGFYKWAKYQQQRLDHTGSASALPPHLLLFPLWPASVVCLGWLIIRDTKILLSPSPPFPSTAMSHFLARASVAGPRPGDTLLFIARFHPRRGESGKAFSVESGKAFSESYTHTQTLSAHPHTYRIKLSMLRHTHTHTHFLAWS